MKAFVKMSKKSISVFMAVVMIMTAWVCAVPVFAADECTHSDSDAEKVTVSATCTQKGYELTTCKICGKVKETKELEALGHEYGEPEFKPATCTEYAGKLYTCIKCDEKEAGHSYFDRDYTKKPLGHDMTDWYYVQNANSSYTKRQNCLREECDYVVDDANKDTNEVYEYYKVTYKNPYSTDITNATQIKTISNGAVVSNGVYSNKEIGVEYVIKGTKAQTPSSNYSKAYKAPTEAAGKYAHTGWTVVTPSASLDNVTTNMVAEAQFEKRDAYYTVQFYNYTGAYLEGTRTILHGHSVEAPKAVPTHPDTLAKEYTFDHYQVKGTEIVADLNHIYNNVEFEAVFTATDRQYKIVYHDAAGNKIDGVNDIVKIGDMVTNGFITKPEKASDDKYSYKFDCWQYANGSSVNLNRFNLNNENNVTTEELEDGTVEKNIVNVYPKFTKVRAYRTLILDIQDEYSFVATDSVVKIYDENNLFVTSAVVGEENLKIENLAVGTYRIVVTHVNKDEVLEKTIYLEKFVPENEDDVDNGQTVQMVFTFNENPGVFECTCFCHVPVLGRLFAWYVKLFNRITGSKTPCCADCKYL